MLEATKPLYVKSEEVLKKKQHFILSRFPPFATSEMPCIEPKNHLFSGNWEQSRNREAYRNELMKLVGRRILEQNEQGKASKYQCGQNRVKGHIVALHRTGAKTRITAHAQQFGQMNRPQSGHLAGPGTDFALLPQGCSDNDSSQEIAATRLPFVFQESDMATICDRPAVPSVTSRIAQNFYPVRLPVAVQQPSFALSRCKSDGSVPVDDSLSLKKLNEFFDRFGESAETWRELYLTSPNASMMSESLLDSDSSIFSSASVPRTGSESLSYSADNHDATDSRGCFNSSVIERNARVIRWIYSCN